MSAGAAAHSVDAILDGAPDAVVVMDAEGRVTRWNVRAAALFGWSAEEAIGRTVAELVVPAPLRPVHKAGYERLLRTGEAHLLGRAVEVDGLRRDGTTVPVELTLSQIQDGDGTVSFVAFLRDVSERRAAERRLAEAQALAHVGSWELDLERDEVALTDELRRIMGVPMDAPPPTLAQQLARVHPDDRQALRLGLAASRDGGETENEYRVVHDDGTVRWVHGRRRVVARKPDGTPALIAGTVQDVTEAKIGRMALQEARERFEQAFRNAPIGMALVGTDGRFLLVNDALCQMTGYTREDLKSRNFQAVGDPVDRETDLEHLRSMISGERGRYTAERRYRRADGTMLWAQIAVSLVRDDTGRPSYFITQIEDVTERHRAQQELLRSNAELEQYAHVVSHDLQEPLRTVHGFADLLVRRHGDQLDEDARRYLTAITGGVVRMQELLNALLRYARAGQAEPQVQPVELGGLVAAVLADLQATVVERGARVRAEGLPTVHADPALLRQVLFNLVTNAMKFTPPEEEPDVELRACRVGDAWEVSVTDRGIGIPEPMHERVFELFQRLHTREEYEGTGLGLALCRKVVERHGGTIRLESSEGRGTTVAFTLPDRGAGA